MTTHQEKSTTLLSAGSVTARCEIGLTTLHKWVKEGHLPAIRFSKRLVRYRLSDLEAMLESNAKNGGDQ
jgi:predicted DNA-binding transcriptional regulator AlpA